MKRPRVEPGEYLVTCDRTGFRVLSGDTQKEWDGAVVWDRVFETRHPQDFVRGVRDFEAVPFARPKADPVYLATNEVTRSDL